MSCSSSWFEADWPHLIPPITSHCLMTPISQRGQTSTLLKVISQCMVECMAEPDLLGQMGRVGFEPGSFPPELETFALHRMAFPCEAHPLSLGRRLVPAALPRAGPPNSHS